jgi:hypothetical protein
VRDRVVGSIRSEAAFARKIATLCADHGPGTQSGPATLVDRHDVFGGHVANSTPASPAWTPPSPPCATAESGPWPASSVVDPSVVA